MVDYTTEFVTGKIFWAKVFTPVSNYEGDGKEWAFDFVPDDTDFLKKHKLLDRLKDAKAPIDGDFLHLKKPELDKDGNKNPPIDIYDSEDQQWDSNKLIGNGSTVDVKLTIADFGKGKKKAIWTKAIRVQELVPYVSNAFGGMGKDAPPKKEKAPKPEPKGFDELDLDDEIPF